MTVCEAHYYMSPVGILLLGCGFIAGGVLGIIFRQQVKDFTVSGQRAVFGSRTANKT